MREERRGCGLLAPLQYIIRAGKVADIDADMSIYSPVILFDSLDELVKRLRPQRLVLEEHLSETVDR